MMTMRITTLCSIALLCVSVTPAASGPFDILVGCWKGRGVSYSTQGVNQGSVCSRGVTYWKTRPTLMHFREEQGGCSATGELTGPSNVLEYDLQVNNTSLQGSCSNCGGSGANIHVIGTETPGNIYHFQVNIQNSGGGDGTWYNHHYFTGRIRHVLGFHEPAGQAGVIDAVAAQTLKHTHCKG